MTRFKRIKELTLGIAMLLTAFLMLAAPSDGYRVIILIFAVLYTVRGIGALIYFFTMARFMVNGRASLYSGLIMLNFGLLTGTLGNVPRIYILLYLAIIHAFSGGIKIVSAVGAGRSGAPWRLKMIHGAANIALSVLCIVFIRHTNTAVIIYAIGLVYSALMHILTSFTKSVVGRKGFI